MEITIPRIIDETSELYQKLLPLKHVKTCSCEDNRLNCMTAKEWVKSQLGVWQFNYEGRDIRDKSIHPATFPLSLSRRIIELFTHQGELVLDPFVGVGTTLVSARDTNRNAIGFDLLRSYVEVCAGRLAVGSLLNDSQQIVVCDDAINIDKYVAPETVKLIWTSPPYANLLNRKRKNKSRRDRKNDQYMRVEQYSQNPRDLGTMPLESTPARWAISSNGCCRS